MAAVNVRLLTEDEVRRAIAAGEEEAKAVTTGMTALLVSVGGDKELGRKFFGQPIDVFAQAVRRDLNLEVTEDGAGK